MDRADRYPVFLLFAFVIWWTALAIHPSYRQDWLLENLLIFIFVPWLRGSEPSQHESVRERLEAILVK